MATKEEQRTFSAIIEEIVKTKKIGYMDAVLLHCEETSFEVELAATLLTTPIKSKINDEAQAANMIKKVNKLPI
jgi:argonaute-like protein implicated in RNA metabolism and viral defense